MELFTYKLNTCACCCVREISIAEDKGSVGRELGRSFAAPDVISRNFDVKSSDPSHKPTLQEVIQLCVGVKCQKVCKLITNYGKK